MSKYRNEHATKHIDSETGEILGFMTFVDGEDGTWVTVRRSAKGPVVAEIFLDMFYMNATEEEGGSRFCVHVQDGDPVVRINVWPGIIKIEKDGWEIAHSHHSNGNVFYAWEAK